MSYSRWSNSCWYTFWHVQDKKTENRDTAIFCICGVIDFTAKELRENLEGRMAKVQELDPEGNINELIEYVKEFLQDVDRRYPA